jgi:hypothetical protein
MFKDIVEDNKEEIRQLNESFKALNNWLVLNFLI